MKVKFIFIILLFSSLCTYSQSQDSLLVKDILKSYNCFKTSYNKQSISKEFRVKWEKYFNDNFKIVNPNRKFASTDNANILNLFLPTRQLIFSAKCDNLFMIVYNQGGRGFSEVLILYDKLNDKAMYLTIAQNTKSLKDVLELLSKNKFQILGVW